MRLAVVSDIHGNLPALQAVLARVDALSVDRVVNLGDCASGPLWPFETVKFLRRTDWIHVRGNHDRLVGESTDGRLGRSDSATWKALDSDARAWLLALPMQASLDGVLCMHASPEGDETYLLDQVVDGRLIAADMESIQRRVETLDARVVLCGHSHLQRCVELADDRTIVNPGSIGGPAYRSAIPPYVWEAGSPDARFAVVAVGPDGVEVMLETVAYDWELSARRAEDNGRPEWAYALRTGRAH